jgi:hypothetical protein
LDQQVALEEESLVLLDLLVPKDQQEAQVKLVHPGLQDQQVLLDQQVLKELLALHP